MLYPELLPSDFQNLPLALQLFHSAPGGGNASGFVTVRRRNGLLAALIGFPPAGDGIAMRLQVRSNGNEEVWTRSFGEIVRRSIQRREGDLLLESVGPVRVFFRVSGDRRGMRFHSLRARLWIFPVPLRIEAHAWGSEASWEFEVKVAGVGSYRGEVAPTA